MLIVGIVNHLPVAPGVIRVSIEWHGVIPVTRVPVLAVRGRYGQQSEKVRQSCETERVAGKPAALLPCVN